MQSKWWLLTIILLASTRMVGADKNDGFHVERRKVAYSDGGTISRVLRLYPEQNTTELAFDQAVSEPGTRTLRVHFVVEGDPAGSMWFVQLLNSKGTMEWTSTEEDRKQQAFWSGEIDGDRADVVLHIIGKPRDIKVQIDKLAITGLESKPQSITTRREDIVPVLGQPADIQNLGKAIARIRYIGDDGGRYFCTGFLVAADLLMTNEHCFTSSTEALSALIDFDFDAADSKPKTVRVATFLWSNFALDYALARLTAPSDQRPAVTLAPSSVQLGKDLLVIQHPEGQFKQVSVINCQISGNEFVEGRSGDKKDFSHLCNTVGGSSGSAVWDRRSHQVIGIHHFGFKKGAVNPSNQAVDIGAILEDIFERDPKVYWSLNIANPKHPKN